MVSDAMKEEAKRIDKLYDEALIHAGLPRSTADGDALWVIIEQHSNYKTEKRRMQLFDYITTKMWRKM